MQVIDNDDSTTGMNTETFSFNTTHEEPAGWPSESGNVSTEMSAIPTPPRPEIWKA